MKLQTISFSLRVARFLLILPPMNSAVVVVLAIASFIHGFKGFCKIKPSGSRALLQMIVPSFLASEDKVTFVLVTRERPSSSQFEGLGKKHDAETQSSPGWLDVGWLFWIWIGSPESQDTYVGPGAAGKNSTLVHSKMTTVEHSLVGCIQRQRPHMAHSFLHWYK